jgi:hypothetical protein
MKCDCVNKKGGTTYMAIYQGDTRQKADDDYFACFTCKSCGRYEEATGSNQKWAELALERKWNKGIK